MIYKRVRGRTKRTFVSFKEICKNSMWKDPASVPKHRAHSHTLPMPPQVVRYLSGCTGIYQSNDCFILAGDTVLPAFHHVQNILTSIETRYRVGSTLSATDLRNAFIRRCIQSGMDLYSLCAYVGIKQPNVIVKRFGEYFVSKLDDVSILQKYIDGSAPQKAIDIDSPRQMNLLILGAGS